MRKAIENLSLLNSLGREIAATLELKKFVPNTLESIAHVMGSDLTLLYLRQGNKMLLQGAYPPEERYDRVGTNVEVLGRCLCGLAGAGDIIYSSDIHSDPKYVLDECKNAGIKSFAALPIAVRGKVLGVLSLASSTTRDFSEQSDFIEAVTAQLAVALQNSLLYEEVTQQVDALERSVEEQKRMEERYQIVTGLTSDYAYAYRVAPDGKLANDWVTGAFQRISGYTKEEILARGGWETLLYPEDLPIAEKQLKALFENQATEVEYRIITKTGQIRWMRDYARPVMDKTQQKLEYIYGAVQDISEPKNAQMALSESEEKYRQLVENISDTIFLADQDGKLAYISPAIEAIAGYEPSELIGQRVQNYIFQEDLPALQTRHRELRQGIAKPLECRLKTKSGKIRWIRISSNPVFSGKKLTGIRGILTDIDESKKMEGENRRLQEQLQQAQKMEAIGTLAGGIAHDFNNILAAIIGYTEMAIGEAKQDTSLYQNLQEIFQAGGRARDLVKQILTFSRQTAQERQPVQVKLIAREVIKFMRASLPATIKISQETQSDALVMADPTHVYQIILNLCTNAGQAMAENGGLLKLKLSNITIDADVSAEYPGLAPGPYALLTVSDTGHGIAESVLNRVFDPFFTTKDKENGTGMGLSVVHGIVGSYGGRVTVASEPKVGSTFTVYLPIIEQFEELLHAAEAHIVTGSEHILLVDDEPALTKVGKRTLESLGYKVTTRTSSLEALELFKAKPDQFDLVLTDMTMPNLSGDQLSDRLTRLRPDIPVILCTGYSNRIDNTNAGKFGIRAIAHKPLVKKDLARIIRRVLDEK